MAREHGAWVRLHYVYPYPHVDDVDPADGRRRRPRGLLPYLDVPFQHASPRILKLMKRPGRARARARAPRARGARAARTSRSAARSSSASPARPTPSSTSCSRSCDEAELDRVGCFAYSPVDGATANALPDPVPDDVREERRARFMAVQAAISAAQARAPRRHARWTCSSTGTRRRRSRAQGDGRARAQRRRCAGDRRRRAHPRRRARSPPGTFATRDASPAPTRTTSRPSSPERVDGRGATRGAAIRLPRTARSSDRAARASALAEVGGRQVARELGEDVAEARC